MNGNFGSFASEDEALTEIVTRLARAHNPEAIWLFGSRARGDHHPESDFDLLVVVRDPVLGRDTKRIRAPLRGLGVGCDVLPCPADKFEEAARTPGTLCRRVKTEGRLVYERH